MAFRTPGPKEDVKEPSVIGRAVDGAYRVIEEYMKQGEQAARSRPQQQSTAGEPMKYGAPDMAGVAMSSWWNLAQTWFNWASQFMRPGMPAPWMPPGCGPCNPMPGNCGCGSSMPWGNAPWANLPWMAMQWWWSMMSWWTQIVGMPWMGGPGAPPCLPAPPQPGPCGPTGFPGFPWFPPQDPSCNPCQPPQWPQYPPQDPWCTPCPSQQQQQQQQPSAQQPQQQEPSQPPHHPHHPHYVPGFPKIPQTRIPPVSGAPSPGEAQPTNPNLSWPPPSSSLNGQRPQWPTYSVQVASVNPADVMVDLHDRLALTRELVLHDLKPHNGDAPLLESTISFKHVDGRLRIEVKLHPDQKPGVYVGRIVDKHTGVDCGKIQITVGKAGG